VTVRAPSSECRAVTLIAVSAVLAVLATLPPAAAGAPLADCTAHRGTIVAVDFGHWGGPIVRGCGVDQPTGYTLLHAAGFTTAGDAQDGNVFICRLGDAAFRHGTQYPTPSEDACIVTPPGSAYWSFWLAPAGQNTWTYSSLGPLGDVPKPGEVELWKFGGTKIGGTSGSGVPHFSPNTLRAAAASSTASTHTTTSTTTTTTQAPTAPTTTTATHPTTKRKRRARARRRAHAHTAAAPPATTNATTPQTSPPVVAAKPTRETGSAGSPVALIVGICVALVLAGAGAWTAWRRRRLERD
jgi:LPXTG-motif cell wall-anchored protein